MLGETDCFDVNGISMTNVLYDGVFARHADSDKIFLYTAESEISFAGFAALTNRLANVLVANGLNAGDRVAVQADKSAMQLALYAATIKAGGVYLPLNTAYTPHEIEYFITDAKPAIVVVGDTARDAISPIAAQVQATLLTLG